MASKEERDHEDQHVAHVAFKISDFWPHDPNTWFRRQAVREQEGQHRRRHQCEL